MLSIAIHLKEVTVDFCALQVASSLTGPIIVEDVTYDDDPNSPSPSNDMMFRLLTFQRTVNLVQSEALLTKTPSPEATPVERKRLPSSSKSKKKGSSRQKDGSTLYLYFNFLSLFVYLSSEGK